MEDNQKRLMKLFLTNLLSMLGAGMLAVGYVIAVMAIDNIYISSSIAIGVPLIILGRLIWDQSKYQLDRQLYEEKRIADRLARDD